MTSFNNGLKVNVIKGASAEAITSATISCLSSKSIATEKATEASVSASSSSMQASIATAQAVISTTKASEASVSASNSQAYAQDAANLLSALSNVDNTSDLDKPVSNATQTALNLKANLASPTFTGTVSGISKSMVGLANVDNTADSAKVVASAAKLTTARTINGELFDGTADIMVATKKVDMLYSLRTITEAYETVWVSGYHTKNDGAFGSHIFRLKGVKTTETDNGGTVIVATIGGVDYVYELQFDGAVNVKWFGAKGDGIDDDSSALQDALNYGNFGSAVFLPKGVYGIAKEITLSKFGSYFIGENTEESKIKLLDTYTSTAEFAIDHYSVETNTAFNHANFTIDLNNKPTKGFRIWRPYDNCSAINVNIINGNDMFVDLEIGGNRTSQTFYMRNVSVLPYSQNKAVAPVKIKVLQESTFELCKFLGAKYIGGSPYVGTNNSVEFEDCRSINLDNCSFVTSSGFKIYATSSGGTRGNFTITNPVFEDVTSAFELIGDSGASLITGVDIINPRFVPPYVGTCIFGDYAYLNSLKSHTLGATIILSSLSKYNKIEIEDSAVVTDGGTRNLIIKTPYLDGDYIKNSNSKLIGNSLSYKISTPLNTYTSALKHDASDSVDNGVYLYRNGKIAFRDFNIGGNTYFDIYSNAVSRIRVSSLSFSPVSDNSFLLGEPTKRWSTIYSGTGTINTSDDREKTYIEITNVEKQVALELKANMKKFRFNDAIETKGESKARVHFGASAQTIKAIFEKYGLNGFDYAILCYDEWDAEYETKIIEEGELDKEGNTIKEAIIEEVLVREAGNRYGIRYEELLCFIISAM